MHLDWSELVSYSESLAEIAQKWYCSSVCVSPRVAYWGKVSCWGKCGFSDLPLKSFFPSLWALGGSANRPFFLSRYTRIHIQLLRFWTDSCASGRCIFTPIVLSSSICQHFIVKKSSSLQVIDTWFIQKDIVYYCHHFFSSLIIHIQPAGSALTSLRWLNVFMCHRHSFWQLLPEIRWSPRLIPSSMWKGPFIQELFVLFSQEQYLEAICLWLLG